MLNFLGYVAVFAAGVVLDEFFGARIVAKFQALLSTTEANLKAEIVKLTPKL
jgi:hypothetical protein